MKIYVTEMPKSKDECFFCQNDLCGICKNSCVVENCCCLEKLVVSVKDVDKKNDKLAN